LTWADVVLGTHSFGHAGYQALADSVDLSLSS
jgi:hypothetical protein